MYSSSVIFSVWVLCTAISRCCHCDTIEFQPGLSYSWIIPPRNLPSSPPAAGRPSEADFDSRNESPITNIGGYGHPPFYLRHSHEQLTLPNEFLITPSDPQRDGRGSGDGGGGGGGRGLSHTPLFRQLDPVDCDGDPTCPNVDITQQQHQQQQSPTTIYQSNIDSVPAITPPEYRQRTSVPASLGQAVTWPSSHGGGIGLLFFVPESASHLPVEQLIRQQLALHRTQFPIDISINCEDVVGSGCRPAGGLTLPLPPPPPPATTVNERNAENENGNYASPPLVEIVNSSSRRGSQQHQQRKWRTIGERIVRNNEHHNRLQQQQIQQQLQLQQNQRELSILPQ